MNVLDHIDREGMKVIPNPNYNPRAKKNKQPKYIKVQDDGEETDPIVRALRDNINNSYAIGTNVLDKYSRYGVSYSPRIHQNLDFELSEAQSNWSKLGNSLVQTLSEVGLGTVQSFTDLPSAVGGGIGQLIDGILGDVFNVKGNPVQNALGVNQENPYSNQISDTIQEWRDKVKNDIAPVYVTPGVDIDNGGFGNVGWYLQNLPNLASTLTLLIPTKAVTGAIGLVTKGLRAANTARKTEKLIEQANKVKSLSNLAKTEEASRVAKELNAFERFRYNPIYQARAQRAATDLGEGLIMRTIENYQEAHQTYQDMYAAASERLAGMDNDDYAKFLQDNEEELQADGIDTTNKDQVAKWVAKQAADRTFKLDYSNLLFDVIQLHSVRDIGKTAKRVTSPSIKKLERKAKETFGKSSDDLAKGAAKSKLKELGHTITDYTTGAAKKVLSEASEGIEEAVNYIAQQEGITYGNTLLDGETDSTLGGFWNHRLRDYLNNSELHESAFWGVGGGVVFGKFAGAYNRMRAYRANKALEDARKENKTTGEQITTNDSSNPLNDFIRLSEMPEIQAAKEAINRRGSRAEQLFRDLEDIKDGKDPYNERKEFEGDKEIAAALARTRAIQEFRYELAMDAINSGTYDSLIDWFKNDNVKEVFGANTEDGAAFVEESIRDLEAAKNAYYNELSHVNAQVAQINARRKKSDKVPLEYVQIIAKNNAARRLEIQGLERQIKSLEVQEADELANTNLQLNESMDVRKTVRMSMLADRYARLEADKRAVKEDEDLSDWRKAQSIKDIESQQDTIVRMITEENMVPAGSVKVKDGDEELSVSGRARALGVALQAFRMAKAYRKVEKDDYRLDEREFGKTDEELIAEYESVFKDAPVSHNVIGQLSRVFNQELNALTNETGLIKQNKKLYDLYANLAVLENQRAITGSEINSTEAQIRTAVDVLHNQRNQVRMDMIMKAQKTIRELHDKYADTAAADIERVVAAAYMQDPEEATRIARESLTGTDEEGHRDSEKLISALAIINFSQASNIQALEFIGTILQGNAEKHKHSRKKNPISQNQVSASQNTQTNNISSPQQNATAEAATPKIEEITPTNTQQPAQPLNDEGNAETGAEETTQTPNVADSTVSIPSDDRTDSDVDIVLENGKVKQIKSGYGSQNPIPTKVQKNGREILNEVLISTLPTERQTAFILSDLFNQIEGDILNDKLALRVVKNPVTRTAPGGHEIVEKGDVELINTETNQVVSSTASTSSTGEGTEPASTDSTPATPSTDNAPANTPPSGELSDLQKEAIVETAIGQFLDITMENPDYDSIAASTKEYITNKYGDKLSSDEINSLVDNQIAEFKDALEQLKSLSGSGLEAQADKLTFAARYEEKNAGTFSNMFKNAAEGFIKEYAAEFMLPVIDGKQVIRFRDILNICNERAKTDGNDVAKAMYTVVSNYLLSPEGRTKYIVADEADINQNKVLQNIGKTSDELISENVKDFEQRVDLDLHRANATANGDTAWFATLNQLRVGDTLTMTNERVTKRHGHDSKGWALAFRKNGVLIGSMPMPYSDGNGGYYWYNEGWRTDVSINDGDPQGEFLDLLKRVFIPADNDDAAKDLHSTILDPSLARDENGIIHVTPEIINKFAGNKIIEELVAQSLSKEGGQNKIYIDFTTKQPDYVNMIKHLRKLWDYSASCVGIINDKEEQDDAIRKSLNSWCLMLFQNYDNIWRQEIKELGPGASTEVKITEITDGGINLIVPNPKKGEDIYDKLLPVASALAPGTNARIAIVNPTKDSEIIVSPESGNVQDAYDNELNFKAARTLIAIYGRNGEANYVTALGARISDTNTLNSPTWKKIGAAVRNGLTELLDDIATKQDKQSIKKLDDFLARLIATKDTPGNIVPLFRGVNGSFSIVPVSTNDWEGINIIFGNETDFKLTAIYNRTRYGGFGYKPEHGDPITVSANKDGASAAADAIIRFLNDHGCINVDVKGIKADSDGEINDGWIRKEFDETTGKSKIVLDIPGPATYREEFDSYNDYLIKNNFLRVNTYQEDESNFTAQSENQKANQVLKVELPDNRAEITSPVEESIASGSSDFVDSDVSLESNVNDFKTIHQIFEANKENAGLAAFRYLKGDAVVDQLNELLKELGIEEGFDIFPKRFTYNRFYNYKSTEPDEDEDGGFIASTAPTGEAAQAKYYPNGGPQRGLGIDVRRNITVEAGDTLVGFKLLNMLSSDSEGRRNRGIRKMIHERIHQIIHDPNITPDTAKVFKAIEKVYKIFNQEVKLREQQDKKALAALTSKDRDGLTDAELETLDKDINALEKELEILADVQKLFYQLKGDRLLEEFITEGMTNEVLYSVMNAINYKKGSDAYLDNIPQGENKSIFAKLIDLIARLFNWESRAGLGPRREEGLYEKFYQTLRNVFNESETETDENNRKDDKTKNEDIEKDEGDGSSNIQDVNEIGTDDLSMDIDIDFNPLDTFDSSYEEMDVENNGYSMIPNMGVIRRNLPVEQRDSFDKLIQSGVITYKCF